MARPVFFIMSLDCSKEDVNVPWEKRKSKPVDIMAPIKTRRQNLKINLN
jgi:hypothetical protein